MDTQTTTGQRFSLDEAGAQEWLERAVAKYDYEWGNADAEPEPSDRKLPEIGSDWAPRDYDEASTVYLLVRLAVDQGVIAAPEGMDLDYRDSDDSDGGYYCFHVGLGEHIYTELASYSEEVRKLGAPDVKGTDAALSILREAVMKANHALDDLDKYVASRREEA